MKLLAEQLESRFTPGGMLDYGVTDAATSALLTEAAGQIAMGRRVPIVPVEMPKADLVLIASSRDGKPDGFLDAAHDVWPAPNATQDVPSVQAIIDNIQGQFNKTGKPVSVILVGTGYGSQLIVGNSYFWSPDNTDPANATPKLIAACSGEISSIQIMVANGSQKADTFQGLADGLLAPVNAYPGRVAVGGNPVSFLVPVGTPIHTWTPR